MDPIVDAIFQARAFLPSKPCKQCGKAFRKSRRRTDAYWETKVFCGLACHRVYYEGKWSGDHGVEYEIVPPVLCRICGEPTRYKQWRRFVETLTDKIACDKPECRAASKAVRMARCRATIAAQKAAGTFKCNFW